MSPALRELLVLEGTDEPELERQLAWVRAWYSSCRWPQPPAERLYRPVSWWEARREDLREPRR